MAIKTKLPTIEIGVSYQHQYRWSQRDDNGVVTPVDLTNWEGRCQLRKSMSDQTVYADMSTANGKMALAGNVIFLGLTSADTKPMQPVSEGVFSVVLWPAGNKNAAVQLVYGTFESNRIATDVPA